MGALGAELLFRVEKRKPRRFLGAHTKKKILVTQETFVKMQVRFKVKTINISHLLLCF
jgi:hypothetical protein